MTSVDNVRLEHTRDHEGDGDETPTTSQATLFDAAALAALKQEAGIPVLPGTRRRRAAGAPPRHNTGIGWTHYPGFIGETWNPIFGCTKVSPGCTNCYAEAISDRFHGAYVRLNGVWPNGRAIPKVFAQSFDHVQLVREKLDEPRHWATPRFVFTNSMADVFHKDVPLEYLQEIWKVMAETPRHIYVLLTKRADRLAQLAPYLPWPPNVWMGVSFEREDYNHRVFDLLSVPAAVRLLSVEPLLGSIGRKLVLQGIGWAIVGAESGPNARSMDLATSANGVGGMPSRRGDLWDGWVREVRDLCQMYDVPFFYKQRESDTVRGHKITSPLLPDANGQNARTWEQWPEIVTCCEPKCRAVYPAGSLKHYRRAFRYCQECNAVSCFQHGLVCTRCQKNVCHQHGLLLPRGSYLLPYCQDCAAAIAARQRSVAVGSSGSSIASGADSGADSDADLEVLA